MSKVLVASEICARSLRAIGSFPITESAPDPEALREAMSWLDLLLAETAGTTRLFNRLEPGTLSFPIENGTQSYDLYATLGSALPSDRIQFIVDAWLEDGDGNRYRVEIVNERKFEDVAKPGDTGVPYWVHINLQQQRTSPVLRIYPTPDAADTTEWTLKLVAQRYAPTVAPGGVTGSQPSASVMHEFGQAWQRWMVCQLAHDLGAGPIHKIAEASLTRFGAMAGEAKARLLAFENREHETTPPVCEAPSGWVDEPWSEGGRLNSTDYGNKTGRWP